jgi:coenzyme F420-reducing hydrogenase alpha subunit
MTEPKTRTIKVDALARVEGEGALSVRVRNGAVTDIKFRIFEPPRFFEACCAAGTTPKRPTSPRASAASARSPT